MSSFKLSLYTHWSRSSSSVVCLLRAILSIYSCWVLALFSLINPRAGWLCIPLLSAPQGFILITHVQNLTTLGNWTSNTVAGWESTAFGMDISIDILNILCCVSTGLLFHLFLVVCSSQSDRQSTVHLSNSETLLLIDTMANPIDD